MDYRSPGSSVHGITQARTLEWVAISTPGDLPDPGIKPASLTSLDLAGRFFTTSKPSVTGIPVSLPHPYVFASDILLIFLSRVRVLYAFCGAGEDP